MSSPCEFPEGYPKDPISLQSFVKKHSEKPMQAEEVEKVIEVCVDRRISSFKEDLSEDKLKAQAASSAERQEIMLLIQELSTNIKFSNRVWTVIIPVVTSLAIGLILKKL